MFDENIGKLVNKWAASGPIGLQPALRICRELIFFKPDPREKEKKARRKESPFDWSASLEPSPRFQDWEYAEFLDRAVRPLAISAPLPTAKLLVEAVADMMVLDTGRLPDAVDAEKNDASEIWSPRVDQQRHPYAESKADLVRTLTFACERVYQAKNSQDIQQLDIAMRAAKWYVLDRIRYQLYAAFAEQTKSWIRESILSYRGYGEEQYGFEFQRMLRVAFEMFGNSLLTREQLAQILEVIMNAPDKEAYKEFMAEQFTEEAYQRRQEYFQRRQLRPFVPVLFGKYQERYNDLVSRMPSLTDDDFVKYGSSESKTGASRSPKGLPELAALTDENLIGFLNTWEDAHRDPDEWWVDIDFTGLATAFQQLILANPNRFLSWGKRWEDLQRPIYLRYAMDAAAERIAEHQSELPQWLDIADWIMTRPDAARDAEKTSETSRTHPDWSFARKQVVDLIAVCLKKDIDVDLEWRPRILPLLKAAAVAADYYLDSNKPILTPRDYLTDAINTPRGRALENLLQYGFWVRRHEPDADLSDLFDVIQLRFRGSPPLSLPEYALLGASFHQLYDLKSGWAQANVGEVFPQSNHVAWAAGFAAYLRFNSAHPLVFETLNSHLEFAVEHLSLFEDEKNPRTDSVANLGQHLLDYYILGFIELAGPQSLLGKFYRKTEPKYWAALFDHLGRMLSKTKEVKPDITERCKAFFESRLAEKKVEELKEFTFWLKAECLEPKWRLKAFLRTLDVTKLATRIASMITEELAKLMKTEPDLAVECFAKLTEGLVGQPYFYLQPEQVKPILKGGFASNNEDTIQAAKFAQDNLLKAGRSEYRNLDVIKDDTRWL
jgi:hypothetical protein